MGGKLGPLITDDKEVWRLVAAMYLHAGLIHLVMNMVVLVQVGRSLERLHGTIKVAIVYVVSGVFGVIMGAIFDPHALSVGASGAIFGLLGASLGSLVQNWGLHARPICDLLQLLLISGIQLVFGTIPMLDNFSHFFGFTMGILCSLSLFILKRQKRRTGRILATKCHQRVVQILAAVSVPVVLLISLSVLFGRRDGHDLCPWCEKISCIPFPWGCDESKPAGSVDCWWKCDAAVDPRCSVAWEWTNSTANGTAVVQCPAAGGAVHNITVHPIDVSNLGPSSAAPLCRDQCS
mmetsp:Transcript_142019/g.250409  ORF Transcript_142019/g.250409 Transcript_142019/m.250409 type:complete len:292 (+) Transcript_142019:381-1256(+)